MLRQEAIDVEISIVNHANRELLRGLLTSLPDACSGVEWHATVVDNASSDGSVAMVKDRFPAVSLVENHGVLGYGANHNQVLGKVVASRSARYALILNDDLVLRPRSVSALVAAMDAQPALGAIGPQVLNGHGGTQPSFVPFPGLLHEISEAATLRRSRRLPRRGWLAGCCLLVRAAALQESGLFDEQFFLYFEDTDLGLRLAEAGWPSSICPSVQALHYGHASLSRPELRVPSAHHLARSRYLYFFKHSGSAMAHLISSSVRLVLLARWLKATLQTAIQRDPEARILAQYLLAVASFDPGRPLDKQAGELMAP